MKKFHAFPSSLSQGMVFSPVPFEAVPVSPEENEGQESGGDKGVVERKGLVATLQGMVADSLKQILRPIDVRTVFDFCVLVLLVVNVILVMDDDLP